MQAFMATGLTQWQHSTVTRDTRVSEVSSHATEAGAGVEESTVSAIAQPSKEEQMMEFESRPTMSNEMNSAVAESAGKPKGSGGKGGTPAIGEKLAAELQVFEGVVADVRQKLDREMPEAMKCRAVVDCAAELFGVAPTWVAFFREVLGREGIMQSLFSKEEQKAYMESAEHLQVLEMLTTLRSRDLPENDPSESQRMITVRIPKCVHDYICDEANALEVSVNKLCISRLLQRSDERMIPTSLQKRRGRKPGSAGSIVSLSTPTETTTEQC